MKNTIHHVLAMVLAMMLLFLTAHACAEEVMDEETLTEIGMAQPSTLVSDIVTGIDRDSIISDGGTTLFTSIMSDGTSVLFEGTNIAITDDGILLHPGSSVVSLDALGKIYVYHAAIAAGNEAPTSDQCLDIGYGYTFGQTSVSSSDDICSALRSGYPAALWNDDVGFPLAYYLPNFVYIMGASSNTEDITLTSLRVGYDSEAKVTNIAEVIDVLPPYFYTFAENVADAEAPSSLYDPSEEPFFAEEGEFIFSGIPEDASPMIDEYTLLEMNMSQPNALYSDIVAGIDRSSIQIDGHATFFTSIMSDGTPVRFEGTDIVITEDGILMSSTSCVTSLDAVGKISVYRAAIKDNTASPVCDQMLNVGYGYTFSGEKTSVARAADVYTHPISGYPAVVWSEETQISVAFYAPNFVFFKSYDYNWESFTLTSLTIGYIPDEKVTTITSAALDPASYGYYAQGELYNAAKETKADSSSNEYDFYLTLKQDVLDEIGVDDEQSYLHFLPRSFYEVGDLRDAQGNAVSKENARVYEGYTLDVTIGESTFAVALPIAPLYEGAQTFKEARPYSTLEAIGKQHTLVIPVVWADQTDLVSDELYALFQKELGSLIDEQGNPLGDLSDANDESFSLSEYFGFSSYGQLEISSFLTDWYYTDKVFAYDYEFAFPEIDFADEVLGWVKQTYPNTDWTQFDQDGDGIVDSIVLLSVGLSQNEGYTPASFGGAVHSTGNNYGMLAGTQADPQANCFLTVNLAFLKDGETHTLIHEFSHNFGLNDYYDSTGYGINAVGEYDMQSGSVGDWNAYSKLAVGWMQPQVISDLASGESVELTIRSSALAGDVILLPAAGTQYAGPFGEYVTIDLLSPDGVNAYDAAQYGLQETVGVRISHVNAQLRRTTESEGVIGYIHTNGNVIGTELHSNNYEKDGFGIYNIEVIQSGGKNTFTNLEQLFPTLRADDLFYAGDVFTAQDYDAFFYDGLMDSGMPLGYTVRILDIGTDAQGNPLATLRITAD